ncbi:MAG: sulfite exporter TauE/SafE family protein [Gammaproteobacteria bacterium]|nr:sulfite exporter TauE/SafE family protein [Gammaproteobacteria bacterium]
MKSILLNAFYLLTIAILLTGCQTVPDGHMQHNHMHGLSAAITPVTFFVLISTGFLTGLSHCVGMCGALVSAFSMQQKTMKGSITTALIKYQAGRISTYILIGIVMATIGAGLQLVAFGQNFQVGLSIFAGLLMLFIGLSLIGKFASLRWVESAALAQWAGSVISRLMVSNHPSAPFGLGMANGLLPCGPVYAMALLAATAASPLQGGLIMLFFGFGTLPAMLGMGFASARLGVALRNRLYRFAASLIIIVGLQQILRGLALADLLDHFHIGQVMIW